MALRAKAPEFQPNRFKALVYGGTGSGKTHFCCSFPNVYYIDTENVLKYPHYVKMLKENNSVAADIQQIEEIIKEVKDLMSVKHAYKTLVIDSLSMPCGWLAQLEVDRLVNASKNKIEGTEFSAHMAKPKRLTFHLSMLLTRLDMNVIVTAQEKQKYAYDKVTGENKVVGETFDISDKMGYALGTVMHFKPTAGYSKVAYMEKSRYSELPNKTSIPFDDGFDVLKQRFGDEMFFRDVVSEKFATKEQLDQLNHFIKVLNVSEEAYEKWLTSCKCASFDEMSEIQIMKYIDACSKKLTQQGE